jgi:hypothetical protein
METIQENPMYDDGMGDLAGLVRERAKGLVVNL